MGGDWGVGGHFTGGSRVVAASSTFKVKVLPQGFGEVKPWAPGNALRGFDGRWLGPNLGGWMREGREVRAWASTLLGGPGWWLPAALSE